MSSALKSTITSEARTSDNTTDLFEHVASLPKLLLVATGRTGSDFFQSLLDGHPEILQFTGWWYFHQWWQEARCKSNLSDLVDEFVWHTCSQCNHIGKFKSWHNTSERWDQLGPERNQSFEVDIDCFKNHMLSILESRELTSKNFFLAVHLAYGLATGVDIQKTKLLFYHIHHLEKLETFKVDFQDFDVIATVREPRNTLVAGTEHWKKCDPKTYTSQLFYVLIRRIFEEAEPVLKFTNNVKTLTLEDLHLSSKKVFEEFCQTYGLNLTDSLFESAYQGKKWWGDALSGEYLDGFRDNVRDNLWKQKLFWYENVVMEYIFQDRLKHYAYGVGISMPRAAFPLAFFLALLPMKYELDIFATNWKTNKSIKLKFKVLAKFGVFYVLRVILCIQFVWKRLNQKILLAKHFVQTSSA